MQDPSRRFEIVMYAGVLSSHHIKHISILRESSQFHGSCRQSQTSEHITSLGDLELVEDFAAG